MLPPLASTCESAGTYPECQAAQAPPRFEQALGEPLGASRSTAIGREQTEQFTRASRAPLRDDAGGKVERAEEVPSYDEREVMLDLRRPNVDVLWLAIGEEAAVDPGDDRLPSF